MTSTTAAIIAGAISANSVQAAPAALAKTISAVALAKGAAVSGSTLTLVKGALKIMAWTKAKTAIVVGAGILFAAGTTTITIKEIQEHQNEEWQLGEINGQFLFKPPYRTVILPTKSAERSRKNGTGGGVSTADGRGYGINASLEDMLRWAFPRDHDELSPSRTILATELPTNRYDYFSNLPHGSREALEREIRRKFGVIGRFETIETNVLFFKVKYPNAGGLKASTSKTGSSSIGNGEMSATNENMNALALTWEMHFGTPVINQTGLTNSFEFEISWDDYQGGHPNLSGLNQALMDQLGLELVPGTAPVEMLVVEKAGN